jgi:membrane-bound metal-dependent hydrolase YbcI (DUF457 family)
MTTPAGHSLFGLAVFLAAPVTRRKAALILLVLLMGAAFIPDIDLMPVFWGGLDAANNSHQHFTHSLLFTAAAGLALAFIASRLGSGGFLRLSPYFIAAAWSHILLDLLTEDTRLPVGLELFWPFSDARFTSPVSIFGGLAKSRVEDLLSWHNFQVVAGEVLVLAPLVIALWLLRLRRARSAHSGE